MKLHQNDISANEKDRINLSRKMPYIIADSGDLNGHKVMELFKYKKNVVTCIFINFKKNNYESFRFNENLFSGASA